MLKPFQIQYLPEEYQLIESPMEWDHCMMDLVVALSKMSKDSSSKFGCLIVSPDKRRFTTGYNGFPSDIPDVKEWWDNRVEGESDFTKYELVMHAEANAIIQAKTDLTGWTLYVNGHPCLNCAKMIVASKIKRIVYIDKSTKMDLQVCKGDFMFNVAGIEIVKLENYASAEDENKKLKDVIHSLLAIIDHWLDWDAISNPVPVGDGYLDEGHARVSQTLDYAQRLIKE